MTDNDMWFIAAAIRKTYKVSTASELSESLKSLKRTAFQQGVHIAELQGELSLSQMTVDALEKEKLEILDRLVRLESENATLKAKADKEYRGYKFR